MGKISSEQATSEWLEFYGNVLALISDLPDEMPFKIVKKSIEVTLADGGTIGIQYLASRLSDYEISDACYRLFEKLIKDEAPDVLKDLRVRKGE